MLLCAEAALLVVELLDAIDVDEGDMRPVVVDEVVVVGVVTVDGTWE